jgi:hypothetical protein
MTDMGKVHRLTRTLSVIPGLGPEGGETTDDVVAALVHAITDIEDECRAFIDQHLPRLLAADPGEAEDALWDLRFGLQHLAYHLADPPFLREEVAHALRIAEENDQRRPRGWRSGG